MANLVKAECKVNMLINSIFGIDKERFSFDPVNKEYFVRLRDNRELFISGKSVTVTNDYETRRIVYDGNKGRIKSLKYAIENHLANDVFRIAESVADWQMQPIDVYIYKTDVNSMSATYFKTVTVYRHTGFLRNRDRLCYIVDVNKDPNAEDIIEELNNFEDVAKDVDFFDFSSKKLKIKYMSLIMSIGEDLRQQDQRLQFFGGNAVRGLMLFRVGAKPNDEEQAQKIAKIVLSGGIKFNCPLKLRLVDISASDGHSILLNDGGWKKWITSAVINSDTKWCQIRAFKDGEYAIKGTSTIAHLTNLLSKYMPEDYDIDGVCDIKSYTKAYGKKNVVGDIVEVSEWLVLRTDSELGVQKVNLSHQALDRAPVKLHNQMSELIQSEINKIIQSTKDVPTSILSDFGFYKKMKQLNIPLSSFGGTNPDTGEKSIIDYAKEVKKQIHHIAKKIIVDGVDIPGAMLALVHADIKFDECLVSLRTAAELNINIGDRITIIRYPIMPGTKENNASMCSKQVIGFIDANVIALNAKATEAMFGDYDGDCPIITKAFAAPEQIVLNYSKSKIDNKGPKKPYTERGAIEVYLRTASNVGMVSNLVTTAMKYKEFTDEERDFLGNCEYAPIFQMKHETDPKYSQAALIKYLQTEIPQMWDKDKPWKYVAHPDIRIRKGNHIKKDKTYEDFISGLNIRGLTVTMKQITDTVKKLKPFDMKTQTHEDFQLKAVQLYRKYSEKYNQEMRAVKEKTVAALYAIPYDNIEERQEHIRRLSASIKSAIGEDAHYLLSLLLFIDGDFQSIYVPFIFADDRLLRDIDNVESRTILSAPKIHITINSPSSVITTEAKKENSLLIWRSSSLNGNNLNIDDVAFTIEAGKVKINENEFNINTDRSDLDGICDGSYQVCEVVEKVGKTGYKIKIKRIANN